MQIISGNQVKIGSSGYIVSVDLTDYDINTVLGVQVRTTSLIWSAPVTNESTYDELCGYLNSAICPDVAFSWMRNNLFIFVSNAYTYASTTLLTFWYYRNAQVVNAFNDNVDIPPEMEELASLLILRKMYIDKNMSIPQNIGQQIRIQCDNLNIQYPV